MKPKYPVALGLAVVAQQALGALWYSPLLFTGAFLQALGKTPQTYDTTQPLPYVVSILSSIVVASLISCAQEREGVECSVHGAFIGGIAALGIAIPVMIAHDLFRFTPFTLTAIDCGSTFVNFVAAGFVLGHARSRAAGKKTAVGGATTSAAY